MDGIRFVVLSDNRPGKKGLDTEHGLSIHLECPSGRFLLDTGSSGLFAANAEKLGIDLREVDWCLISHGHRDHIGGLTRFLEINRKAKVILSSHIQGSSFFSARGGLHQISVNMDFRKDSDRFIFIDKNREIGNIHIYSDLQNGSPAPKGNHCLSVQGPDGKIVPDPFLHELAFVIDGVLFTGCAHSGLLNILGSLKEQVKVCIGGFHLPDTADGLEYESDDELRGIAEKILSGYPDTSFHTGHCTGDHSFDVLYDSFQGRLHQFRCGDSLMI